MTTDPASVVLVPGACCGPWIWADLVRELEQRGVDPWTVDLPSIAATPPRGDLYDDAATVAALIDRVDAPIVLVGHSSGGMVITQAAIGREAHVRHLVYLAAPLADEGEALLTMKGAPDPADAAEVIGALFDIGDDGTVCFRADAASVPFGPDCDQPTMDTAVANLLPMAMVVYGQPVTGAPWRTIPSTFVRCEHDGFGNGPLRDLLAVSADRAGNLVSLPCGHSPQLSRPDLVADLITPLAQGDPNSV